MQTKLETKLACNIGRLMDDVNAIANAGLKPPYSGCTRHSYTQADHVARKYLMRIFKDYGLTVTVDGVGNVRARMKGRDDTLAPVLVGSHIDTVTDGGRLDGLLGVVCALETVRVFSENRIVPLRPVEVVIFVEEEGSNFGVTLLGSKSLVGKLTPADLRGIRNDGEESAYDVIQKAGYDVDVQPLYVVRPGEVAAMVELHIEQGGILEHRDCPIGIVRSIAGMRNYKVALEGVSNHAGSTPMFLRQDPLLGAAHIITAVNEAAAQTENGTVVATVGKIACHPNASNAINEKVELFVDIRDVEEAGIAQISGHLEKSVRDACQKYHLKGTAELIAQSDVVHLDTGVVDVLCQAADGQKLPYHYMNSGAVHDAVMMTGVTRVGMVFVPSIGGLSHCPQEDTRTEDIHKGCDLLIEAIYQLANQ